MNLDLKGKKLTAFEQIVLQFIRVWIAIKLHGKDMPNVIVMYLDDLNKDITTIRLNSERIESGWGGMKGR